jgi:hypothetical protein
MRCEINLFIVGMITASFGEVLDEIAELCARAELVAEILFPGWSGYD